MWAHYPYLFRGSIPYDSFLVNSCGEMVDTWDLKSHPIKGVGSTPIMNKILETVAEWLRR